MRPSKNTAITVKCQISGRDLQLNEAVPVDLIRDSLLPTIKAVCPNLDPDGYVAIDELNKARLKHADRIEAVIRKGVIATLRERLDAGARRELERLEAIAGPTVFPRTPIATSIIHDSAGPEDLLRIALELREEFTGFRQAMRELETELFSEETDLRHRIRILNDIEGISRELWPTPRDGFRASFVEATGLITKVADLTPGSTVTQLNLIAQILSKPVEAVLRGIKRRKIRVLLQAKRDFLKSKRHTDKIKEIFRLTDRQVSTAIESVAESKHETVSTGPDSIGSIR